MTTLHELIKELPEVYQPIYKHPEFSKDPSRICGDRLQHITDIYRAFSTKLNRPLRVIDIGCAQGYFSFYLAEQGARVLGIDYLDKNIAVCQFLANKFPGLDVQFETGHIEEVIENQPPNKFDMVIGLSVFHHLVHEHGLSFVQKIISKLAQKIPAGIFEFALQDEPVYWGASQPSDPADLIQGYSFIHKLAHHKTHLSNIRRPLYFAGNGFWYLSGQMGRFDSYQSDSHPYAHGIHQNTRRYFFGEKLIVKTYRIIDPDLKLANEKEFDNEARYLQNPPPHLDTPRLVLFGRNDEELWLVRELIEGRLLTDYFDAAIPFDHDKVIEDILMQVVALEKADLYHEDVRCWNVILDNGGMARLIDYGAISSKPRDCSWPHNLFMSFFIFVREVIVRRTKHPLPTRPAKLNPNDLPQPYRDIFWLFFTESFEKWSFAQLQKCSHQVFNKEKDTSISSTQNLSALLQAMEEAVSISEKHSEWLEDRVSEFNKRAQKAETRAHQFEKKAEQAEAKAHQVEKRAEQAEVKAHQFEKKAEQAEARAYQFEIKAEQAEVKAHQFEKKAQQAETRAFTAEQNAENSESIAQEAKMLAEAAQAQAHQFHAQLNAVYNSYSWRITWPLRKTVDIARWSVNLPMRLSKWMIRFPGNLLAWLMAFAIKRGSMRVKLLERINKHPWLKARLTSFGQKRGVLHGYNFAENENRLFFSQEHNQSFNEQEADLQQMTPRAREIYHDLKKAIEQRQKERV